MRRLLQRCPLRLRVALAFLAASAVALSGLGLFVVLGVRAVLDERLADTLEAEADRLAAATPEDRGRMVAAPPGELVAQVLERDGSLLLSSPDAVGALWPDATGAGAVDDSTLVEAGIAVRDDDETEGVDAFVLARPSDDGQVVVVVAAPRDDEDEAVAAVRTLLLVGGPAALLLAGALGYAVAGAGLRPIERMRERAATISDRSAGERLPIPEARDELRRLAQTLNAMLDRLDDGLRRQRRFVAEASHELRTPLALMRTEIDLALSRPRSAEELADALRSNGEETERLAALVDQLLVLAAADTGRLTLDRTELDLAGLARDVVRRFGGRARELGRTLTTVTEAESLPLAADAGRLDQVVSNLVDNALRHGAGAVEVAVRRRAGAVEVVVSDEGPGVTAADAFERFGGSPGGQGLGLAIVREIARAHGGEVTAVPRGAGDRSHVVVVVPEADR